MENEIANQIYEYIYAILVAMSEIYLLVLIAVAVMQFLTFDRILIMF